MNINGVYYAGIRKIYRGMRSTVFSGQTITGKYEQNIDNNPRGGYNDHELYNIYIFV